MRGGVLYVLTLKEDEDGKRRIIIVFVLWVWNKKIKRTKNGARVENFKNCKFENTRKRPKIII